MKVSVVIPSFNQEKFLPKTLISVLEQKNFTDFEIILVDDNPSEYTDNNVEIFEELCNRKMFPIDFTRLSSTNPKGISHARNKGIKAAKGEWIKLLDSDDMLKPNFLQLAMKIIEERGEKCIYYSDYETIFPNGMLRSLVKDPGRNLDISGKLKEMRNGIYANMNSTVIHKSVFEKIGYFDESMDDAEDYEFFLRALSKGIDLIHLPICELQYRIHPEQRSNASNPKIAQKLREKY